ncbi:MAG: hypothetical protein Q4E68_10425 [Prevotellaceae bacterium]|nr:hypothetical protein [Prevotellaceae bacterium]
MEKVKIVLDADVLIHFAKADAMWMLPNILPEYEYIVLSAVYEEVKTIRQQLDNQIQLLKNIKLEHFAPTGQMRREYASLLSRFGKGESACMAYCRFTNNVIGSSNLRDIKKYCEEQRIVYLTSLDFLYYAYVRGKMTEEECKDFIVTVNAKGSKIPTADITTYMPNSTI